MVGVAVQNEPYISFFDRARRRLDDWRNDCYHFRPPVGPRGYAVFLAWDRLTGRVRNEPFEDVIDPFWGVLGGILGNVLKCKQNLRNITIFWGPAGVPEVSWDPLEASSGLLKAS